MTTFTSRSSSRTDAPGSGAVATSMDPLSNMVPYWAGLPVTCFIDPPTRSDVTPISFIYVSNCTSCVQPICGDIHVMSLISAGISIPLSLQETMTDQPVDKDTMICKTKQNRYLL